MRVAWNMPEHRVASVLAFASSDAGEAMARELIAAAGARTMRTGAVADGEAALDQQSGADAVLVVADADEPALPVLLDRLDAMSSLGGVPIVAVIAPHLIDLVSSALAAPETIILSDPDQQDAVAALAAAVRPRDGRFHDATSERNALQLRKLSEDVDRIARTLATLSADREVVTMADSALEEPDDGAQPDEEGATGLIRAMLRARRLRERFFAAELFSDPAWDMLLDLAAAGLDRKRVAVSSLCIAASVPPTTALRYIKTMTDAGLFVRSPDRSDGRRVFIELSEHAMAAMLRYLRAVRRTIDVVE